MLNTQGIMDANYTDITIILDRSGSMFSIKPDMEGGLNTFIEEQKKVEGKCLVTLHQFDYDYDTVFENKTLTETPKIVIHPRGGTALLDAIGKTIDNLGSRLKKMSESERPGKVIVMIITDGEENSSSKFNKSQINEMISHQQEKYNWQFIFLGANQDAIEEASSLGILRSNAMTFAYSGLGAQASMNSVSNNIGAYRSGTVLSASFTPEDRKTQDELMTGNAPTTGGNFLKSVKTVI